MSCEGTDTQTHLDLIQAAGVEAAEQSMSGAWQLALGGGTWGACAWRPGERGHPSTNGDLILAVQICTCDCALNRMSCRTPAWHRSSSETPRKAPSLTSIEFEMLQA